MKGLFEKGLLALFIAFAVAVAGVVFLLMAIAIVGNVLGGLAQWSLIGSMIFGYNLSFEGHLLVAAIMAGIIFLGITYAPTATDKFFETFATLMSLGLTMAMVLAIIGFPGWFIVRWLNDGVLSGWWLWPIGALTLFCYYQWASRKQAKS